MAKIEVPTDSIKLMEFTVRNNLVRCCKELNEYNTTGVLEDGMIKKLAKDIIMDAKHLSLSAVTSYIAKQAILKVSEGHYD